MKWLINLCFLCLLSPLYSQSLDDDIWEKQYELNNLLAEEEYLRKEIRTMKLDRVIRDLNKVGLPTKDFITHTAMILSYSEVHEQAKWVMHVITPEIIKGTVFRSNDFREDSLVTTGTAVEADYFLKAMKADSTFDYDGFGYDRGHLAPSSDFRWSQKALSESYYYSNMSPQVEDFNRGAWAEVETLLRSYVYKNFTQLIVFTAPVLTDDLKKIERGINKVSIPKEYVKVAIDLKNNRGFAIRMPNKKITTALTDYVQSIDEIETLLGYDLFANLDINRQDSIESSTEIGHWFSEIKKGGDATSLKAVSLPKGYFNTKQAAEFYVNSGKAIFVCGTVVSTRYSRSGNLWMNLDKKFPNQVLSVMIKKEDLSNFPYDPKKEFTDLQICFKGKLKKLNGTATMFINGEEDVDYLNK